MNFSQQPVAEIEITANTLVILAPEELQNKINFSKYQNLIVGKPNKVLDFYNIANEITKEYRNSGFPLVRVIVPKQELKPDQATLFLKVIDGFIEKVDLSKVPSLQMLRTYAYLKPIIKKKTITDNLLERQLVLAGNSAGLTLKSGFTKGADEGGAVLVVEAEHNYCQEA